MNTLLDIKVLAYNYMNDILKSAKKIHPKLLSCLTESDFSDQTLYDDSLISELNKLDIEVKKYNDLIWKEASTYFKSIALDMQRENVDIGYHSNGIEINDYTFDMKFYEPSVHMKKIFDTVMKYKNYIQVTPFWKYDVNVFLKDKDVWVNITKETSPKRYIRNGITIINSDVLSKTDELINYIKVQLSTEYKMHTPKYKVRSSNELDINSFITSVQDHKILEELLKMEPGHYNVLDLKCNSDGTLKFKIQKDA